MKKNTWLFKVEKRMVGIIFALMGLTVFIDVTHRVVTRVPGRLALILGRVAHESDDWIYKFDRWITPALAAGLLFVFFLAIFRTKLRALLAVLGVALLAGSAVWLWPQGLPWATSFALVSLLWVGMLGASMASFTHQHLVLEMGEKVWPKRFQPTLKKISAVLTALFCFFLFFLSASSLYAHFQEWRWARGAGLVPSLEWPKWVVLSVVPYAFLMMALRVLAAAFSPKHRGEWA